jgi:hypothetical protein
MPATGETLRDATGQDLDPSRKRSVPASWLSATDHKVIATCT